MNGFAAVGAEDGLAGAFEFAEALLGAGGAERINLLGEDGEGRGSGHDVITRGCAFACTRSNWRFGVLGGECDRLRGGQGHCSQRRFHR